MVADMKTTGTITIHRVERWNGRGALHAFSWVYHLTCDMALPELTAHIPGRGAVALTYEGTPLRSLAKKARTLAKKHGLRVVEAWA